MVVGKQQQRPFTTPPSFVTDAVPQFFEYPRLQLTDENTQTTGFWTNADRSSQFVKLKLENGKWIAKCHPTNEPLTLNDLEHPFTRARLAVSDPLSCVDLLPTGMLHETCMQTISYIKSELKALERVVSLPFHISGGLLEMDYQRALGTAGRTSIGTVLASSDVREFQKPLKQTPKSGLRAKLIDRLYQIGEKCKHMSDPNCGACITDRQFICLRSIVARYFHRPKLLAHKGIELSDTQGGLNIGDEAAIVWGFAKLGATRKTGLTLRNSNGAILLAQVLAQLSKSTFDTVMILSPSTINQDIQNELQHQCGLHEKNLLILDEGDLVKMLLDFEEQAQFDKIDVSAVYRASRSKPKRRKSPVRQSRQSTKRR